MRRIKDKQFQANTFIISFSCIIQKVTLKLHTFIELSLFYFVQSVFRQCIFRLTFLKYIQPYV
jgi:hypothetical protein